MAYNSRAPFVCKNETCRGVFLKDMPVGSTATQALLYCPKCAQQYAWTYYPGGGAELIKVLPIDAAPAQIKVAAPDHSTAVLDLMVEAMTRQAQAHAKELNGKITAYIEDQLVRAAMSPAAARPAKEQMDSIDNFLARVHDPLNLKPARVKLSEAIALLEQIRVSQKKL